MFTGIIREIGRVKSIEPAADTRIVLGCARPPEDIEIGASIACNGVCLTVIEAGRDDSGPFFVVEASRETLSKTTLGRWVEGSAVNLEPALRLGDELGGHIVSGHVDGVGEIVDVELDGASHRVTIEAPDPLSRFIAEKGSIAIDGISLTINQVEGNRFGINVIPHTWKATSFGQASVDQKVNLEIDMLARYVARLSETV